MFIYELYAMNSQGDYKKRKITRKNKLSEDKKHELGGRFADKCAEKYNQQFILYGCTYISEVN